MFTQLPHFDFDGEYSSFSLTVDEDGDFHFDYGNGVMVLSAREAGELSRLINHLITRLGGPEPELVQQAPIADALADVAEVPEDVLRRLFART